MLVAGYIRVSTDKEGQKESPKNQKNAILQFISEKGYDLYDFYVDVESGTTDDRENLKRLIHDAKNKKFNLIVSKELSRLSRNVGLIYELKKIAEENLIPIITLDGQIDTSDPSKSGMFGLYAWVFEQESQRISERVKTTFRVKSKNGKFMGSIPPYGYYVKDKKLYIRNDETVEVVKTIFKKFLSGWGYDKIARYLSKKRYPTPSQVAGKKNAGQFWHGSTVKLILQNQHYVGDLVQCRETRVSITSKKRKTLPRDQWIVVKDTHEPIISREDFEKTQELIQSKQKKGRGKIKAQKHLFTNLLYCADCGKGMWYRQNRKGYICGGYAKHGKIACTQHVIKEDELKRIILEDIRKMATNIDHTELLKTMKSKFEKLEKENIKKLKKIEEQIKVLINRKRNYINLLADNIISKSDYDDMVKDNQKKLEDLKLKKLEIEKSLDKKNSIDKMTTFYKEINHFLGFGKLTQEMLYRFIEKIEVEENSVIKIHYRFANPFND